MSSSHRVVVGGLAVALVITGVLAAFLWVSLSDLRVKYGVLSAKYSSLEGRYGELSSKYSDLLTKYEGLRSNYTALKGKYVAVMASYSELSKEHNALLRNYTTLKEAYSGLKARYAELNSTYMELKAAYMNLQSRFNTLSKTYSSLLSNYTDLRSKYLMLRTEYGDLQAKYSSLETKYSALQEEYSSLRKAIEELMNVTEERGGLDPSYYPKFIDWWSSIVVSTVKSINFYVYADPYRAIYDWIVAHVRYNHDTPEVVVTSPNGDYEWRDDYWQYASETLRNRYGDCEDQAILAAAMVEAYWNVTYGKTYLIYVALVDVKGTGVEGGHALLIVPFQGGEIAIIDPAAHTYVPPMKTLNALQEYEERARWKITYVYGVFDLDEYYRVDASTLEEFAQWLDTH